MTVSQSTSRRDFLRGRSIALAAQEAASLPAPGVSSPAGSRDADCLLSASRRAMACTFQILLPAGIPSGLAAASAALDEIDQLEEQLTVYRDTSEVSRVNALAAAVEMPVEARLFELLERALELNQQTCGAFDIAVGALVKSWGFFRGPKRVPTAEELERVRACSGSRHVRLDRAGRTIRFDRPGVELNLGAIGKGYALDRAAARMREDWGVESALVHGGRSSVLATGAPGGRDAWLVGIEHPLDPTRRAATVRLRDRALGTSGATVQYFEVDGRRFGHILDPRTGWPADARASVSVLAPDAASADALSTALFILGPDAAHDYCRRHPEIGAVILPLHPSGGQLRPMACGAAEGLVEFAEDIGRPVVSSRQ